MDLFEKCNRFYDDPAYASTLQDLRARLTELRKDLDDTEG